MSAQRATVVIRQCDPETDHEDGYAREWVHRDDLEMDEFGVELRWHRPDCTVFVPWASVIRIDTEPCDCFDCKRMAA